LKKKGQGKEWRGGWNIRGGNKEDGRAEAGWGVMVRGGERGWGGGKGVKAKGRETGGGGEGGGANGE